MYKKFFGFRERPFQLVPNPAYLFLSRSHEEALAHLTYAISQGDGFVEITGEVGTGKTTLCRAFLESLDEKTEAAYIFNPKLDALQLLKALNDEFGIDSDADNTKDLIDNLNAFLMEKKKEGKRVIVLIDEAQNLSTEVLEQLRLLSNLETTTSKLLQIILVGQPELGEMLDSHELRQLGQRITLSCHIKPLNLKETGDYIRHRLQVASQKTGLRFTWAAIRGIYKYSGGIPRLINIACDRALLTAFGLNVRKITGGIARTAVRELAGRGDIRRVGIRGVRSYYPVLVAVVLALAVLAFYRPSLLHFNDLFQARDEKTGESGPGNSTVSPEKRTGASVQKAPQGEGEILASTSSPSAKKKEPESRILPEEQKTPDHGESPPAAVPRNLGETLKSFDGRQSRNFAAKSVMDLWHADSMINRYLEGLEDGSEFFRLAAKQNGFMSNRIQGNISLIRKLNLPAIFAFHTSEEEPIKYLALKRLMNEKMVFIGDEDAGQIESDQKEVSAYWTGVAYVFWKNFMDFQGVIPLTSPRDSIISLKMYIQDLGFNDIELNPAYDEKIREAVSLIQEKHGIRVDGIVGPMTKIVLYNENKSLKIPHLAVE